MAKRHLACSPRYSSWTWDFRTMGLAFTLLVSDFPQDVGTWLQGFAPNQPQEHK